MSSSSKNSFFLRRVRQIASAAARQGASSSFLRSLSSSGACNGCCFLVWAEWLKKDLLSLLKAGKMVDEDLKISQLSLQYPPLDTS